MTDWFEITRRNARSVQTTVGWIFWDPGAVARYAAAGLPADFAGPLGYIGARCAPLAGAGPDAVIAAFGSISPFGIRTVFELVDGPAGFARLWAARDEAVAEGLRAHAPEIVAPLVELGPDLWAVVEQLPLVGRTFFGAHLAMPRRDDALLSGWHAINCLREWRGDTHWALVVAAGLTHPEASILHNAWLGYERDWLASSRGATPEEIEAGWASLAARGLVVDGEVTAEGVALRQRIEDDTDRLTMLPWQLLGEDRSIELAEGLEPPCVLLLARVDETAGPNYQPASRLR
ncbi:MAG: SCO6745 family protein [Acidimicrobiales bacterium]